MADGARPDGTGVPVSTIVRFGPGAPYTLWFPGELKLLDYYRRLLDMLSYALHDMVDRTSLQAHMQAMFQKQLAAAKDAGYQLSEDGPRPVDAYELLKYIGNRLKKDASACVTELAGGRALPEQDMALVTKSLRDALRQRNEYSHRSLIGEPLTIRQLEEACTSAIGMFERIATVSPAVAGPAAEALRDLYAQAAAHIQDQGRRRQLLERDAVHPDAVAGAAAPVSAGAAARPRPVISASSLREQGYRAIDLRAEGYDWPELQQAGYSANECRVAGAGIVQLVQVGFTYADCREAGFTAPDCRSAMRERRGQGRVAAAGDGVDGEDAHVLHKAGFNALECNSAGIPVTALCPPFQLADLAAAGVQPAGLLTSGMYTLAQLRDAGYSARVVVQSVPRVARAELRGAGYSLSDVRGAGFRLNGLKWIGESLADLCSAGFTAKEVMDAGYSLPQLVAAGYTARDAFDADPSLHGCDLPSAKRMREAGYSLDDLNLSGLVSKGSIAQAALPVHAGLQLPSRLRAPAGYTPAILKEAGYTPADMGVLGLPDAELFRLYQAAPELKAAGCTLQALMEAGFTAVQLYEAGWGPKDVEPRFRDRTAVQLKQEGYTLDILKDARFSSKELFLAGFTAQELVGAGLGPDLRSSVAQWGQKDAAHCRHRINELKLLGMPASTLQGFGFSAGELKAGGFRLVDFRDQGNGVGFTGKQLLEAGFTAAEFQEVGITARDALGASVRHFKAAGFTVADVLPCRFTAKQLADAGFDRQAILAADFSPQELKAAGFTAADLRQSGRYSDDESTIA